MGNEERELEGLLRIKKRRLAQLRKQAATLGYSATPELLNEIEDLQRETDSSARVIEPITKGELPDDIMVALRAYGVPASVNNALQLVNAGLYDLKQLFKDQGAELHALKDQVLPMVADVKALQEDTKEGKSGRRRNFKLQVLSIILSALALGAFVWLAFVAPRLH